MPKKILIVEDEEYISSMYKMKFDLNGYQAVVAEDGEKGVLLAVSEKPDLILLDLMMPKLDGYQVLEKLKADDRTKNIKVYILSNLGQSSEVEKGFGLGADGFLIKSSLTPAQLIKTAESIFKGESVGIKKPAVLPESKSKKSTIKKLVKNILAKVLLFEDEEVLADMYRMSLAKAGFEVEVAGNGAWGLKLAKENKFDIIIMDMVMPAMDGREAIKQLKQVEATKKIPIIVLSNSAQDKDIEEAKKSGVTSYLLKSSVRPKDIIVEIKKILKIK